MALPKDLKSNNSFSKLSSEMIGKTSTIQNRDLPPEDPAKNSSMSRRGSHGLRGLLLKGQMRFIHEIDSIVFLCSPL